MAGGEALCGGGVCGRVEPGMVNRGPGMAIPSVSFSPVSGGSENPSKVILLIITQGRTRLYK